MKFFERSWKLKTIFTDPEAASLTRNLAGVYFDDLRVSQLVANKKSYLSDA